MMCYEQDQGYIIVGQITSKMNEELFERVNAEKETNSEDACVLMDENMLADLINAEYDFEESSDENEKDLANQVFQPHAAGS